MTTRQLVAAAFLLSLTSACGGGGGGGGAPLFIGGYSARLVPVENNCRREQAPMDRLYTVNQDAERVVVDSDAEEAYEGSVSGEDRFVVGRVTTATCRNIFTDEPIEGSVSQQTEALEFIFIDADTAQVSLTIDKGNCSKNVSIDVTCRIRMTGTAKRVS